MKLKRHFTITEIISNQRIATQDELCEALQENACRNTGNRIARYKRIAINQDPR